MIWKADMNGSTVRKSIGGKKSHKVAIIFGQNSEELTKNLLLVCAAPSLLNAAKTAKGTLQMYQKFGVDQAMLSRVSTTLEFLDFVINQAEEK